MIIIDKRSYPLLLMDDFGLSCLSFGGMEP